MSKHAGELATEMTVAFIQAKAQAINNGYVSPEELAYAYKVFYDAIQNPYLEINDQQKQD